MDIIQRIRQFNAGRDPERLALKYRRMREGPFIFLRASCHLFQDRLTELGAMPAAPLAWLCGDLHLENFGSYKGDNRLVYFDLNDFDEAALGPVTRELVRFLASVLVGAESLGSNQRQALELCAAFLDGYAGALAEGKARWVERDTADGLVADLLKLLLKIRSRDINVAARLIARSDDIDALAAHLADLLRHADKRQALGAAGRRRASAEFSS